MTQPHEFASPSLGETPEQIIRQAEDAITAVLHRNHSEPALQAAEALRAAIICIRRCVDDRDRALLEHQETRGEVAALTQRHW